MDLDAVVAAITATWPHADIHNGCPLAGRTFRVLAYLPDPQGGRNMEVRLDYSGRMIPLGYGSPETSAEFVTWVLNRFPPPDDVPIPLFEWGHHLGVAARTTVQDLLAIGRDGRSITPSPELQVHLPVHADGPCCACNPEDLAAAPTMPLEQPRWHRLTVRRQKADRGRRGPRNRPAMQPQVVRLTAEIALPAKPQRQG